MPFLTAASLLATYANLPGTRFDPYLTCNFFIEIGGIIAGSFTEVSGLESEVQLESYLEGGVNGYIHQLPTQVSFPRLVLAKGLTDTDVLWNWYWMTVQGFPLLLNGTIMLLDNQRLPVMWWNFKDAYPVKWSGPKFDASADQQVGVEQIELVHRGLSKPALSQALSAVRGGITRGNQ